MTAFRALAPAGPVLETLSKACPDCGLVMALPGPVGTLGFGDGLAVYCDGCAVRRYRELDQAARTARLRTRFEALQVRGLVGPELRRVCFRKSDALVEALNPEAWAAARRWREQRNLYVFGPTGVGKSFLARCCLHRAFQHGREVAEVSARRFTKVSDTFAEGRGLFNAWKEATVLLLDDIDKAMWNPDRVGALWELLDARASARRRTLVTGNVSPPELAQILHASNTGAGLRNEATVDATLERLRPCETLRLDGESLRGK